MPTRHSALAWGLLPLLVVATDASAQGFSSAPSKPRPWSRVSFFTNSARTTVDNGDSRSIAELSTAFSYQLPDTDDGGADYGIDVRYSTFRGMSRPDRVSLYEAFAGARMAGGRARVRAGHVWLNDLGSLGSLAGALLEYRQPRATPESGRVRAGVFAGLEPDILDTGYAPDIRKFGAYAGFDGASARRHSFGYVMVKNGALTERSVATANNFLPLGRKLFIYQSAEYNISPPAGRASRGLAYFLMNTRVTPSYRLELQVNYHRGRSIDARGLGDDILNGRPIAQTSIEGLLYESVGGRATVEALPRVRIYAGYSRDKSNRDASATGRTIVGGYASNIGRSGVDFTASDSITQRPNGRYRSQYVSIGRQFGRILYMSGDYSTSLSVVRFSRSDGITIETRPHTNRVSVTTSAYVSRTTSLIATVERTNEDDLLHDARTLVGLTYRIK